MILLFSIDDLTNPEFPTRATYALTSGFEVQRRVRPMEKPCLLKRLCKKAVRRLSEAVEAPSLFRSLASVSDEPLSVDLVLSEHGTMCDFHNFGLINAGQCTVCLKG